MKHPLILTLIYIVSLAVVAYCGLLIGWMHGRQGARIEDWKIYDAALARYDADPKARTIELREFLKARYYYAANQIPDRWLGSPRDYGPVDFTHLPVGKGPTSPREEYRLFKARQVQFTAATTQP